MQRLIIDPGFYFMNWKCVKMCLRWIIHWGRSAKFTTICQFWQIVVNLADFNQIQSWSKTAVGRNFGPLNFSPLKLLEALYFHGLVFFDCCCSGLTTCLQSPPDLKAWMTVGLHSETWKRSRFPTVEQSLTADLLFFYSLIIPPQLS